MIAIRTSTTRARFSRRGFLRAVGASAAFLPVLEAERAFGAGITKRLVTIAWTNGMPQSNFWPADVDPTASDVLKPLVPYKAKVLIPAGLDMRIMLEQNHKYDGHFSYPTLYTGTYKNLGGQNAGATGPSIDQAYSDAVAKQVNLPIPLLNWAVAGKSTSFGKDGARNTAETDPSRLFQRAFSSQTMPEDKLNALKQRRKSVIDFLKGDLDAFSKRIGTDDRAKVNAHLESVRQIELQLAAAGKSCTGVTAPKMGSDLPTKMTAFLDLTALAIRCDLSRSVSMAWGDDGGSGPQSFPFLNINSDYHGIAHQGPGGYAQKIPIDT